MFELTTEAGPDVFSERPFIPITPLLVGPSGLTLELGGVPFSERDPGALPGGYRVALEAGGCPGTPAIAAR